MQSVFGLHNKDDFNIFVYATGPPSDGSRYRKKIEEETQRFQDVSTMSVAAIVDMIVKDQIHIREIHRYG
jgi:protein O-GlcNAc transferase